MRDKITIRLNKSNIEHQKIDKFLEDKNNISEYFLNLVLKDMEFSKETIFNLLDEYFDSRGIQVNKKQKKQSAKDILGI